MSQHYGYICQSHNPPIISDHWLNWGQDVLTEVYRRERAGQWPDVPEDHPFYLAFQGSPQPVDLHAEDLVGEMRRSASVGNRGQEGIVEWLREHPHCVVALHNEYGEVESLDPAPAPMVPDDLVGEVMAHNLPFTRRATLNPVASIVSLLATDSRDWGEDRGDAWLWGIVMGWDDEDLECSAMDLVAAKHGWDAATVARLRILHERFKATLPPDA